MDAYSCHFVRLCQDIGAVKSAPGPRRLPAVVDRIADVVLVLDCETLRVVDVNRTGRLAFGYARAELLELDAFALFPRWWEATKTAAPDARLTTFCRDKSGAEEPVELSVSATEDAGVPLLVVTVRAARELAEVERELAATNAYLHAIVENIPDMIFVKDAETHQFKRFNRAGEELLGFTRGELLGKTDHDFYPKEQADFFHAKDRETFLAKRTVDVPIEPIQTKSRGTRYLHTRKVPVYDENGRPLYLLGISEDITERLRAEETQREFAAVVKNARDAVVTFRPDGTIVSWNPAAERLYGLGSKDAIGKNVLALVPESDATSFRKRQAGVLRGGGADVREVVRVRADGREVDVEESLFALVDAEGRPDRLASLARDLTELARWRRATEMLATPPSGHDLAQVTSPEMLEAVRCADLAAANVDATVLLLGETGVGKSWLARRMHAKSPRAARPMFEINCAGLAPQLVESELFGHERGAFTGAVAQKRGLVETAEGGTLFLDEVGELSLAVQGQLLMFLDTRTFRRVGGNRALKANVRLIAATNMDLKAATEQGRFRRDLFYRLSVVPILIPPLRARRDEIPHLAQALLTDLARRSGRQGVRLGRGVAPLLQRYAWPGNIRELRNALERALIMSSGDTIDVEHLPADIRTPASTPSSALHEVELGAIAKALREANGNRTEAARRLGISRSTLKRRMGELRAQRLV
jgi:PAS domain S-box-containing protein